jgi:hypothetical protein
MFTGYLIAPYEQTKVMQCGMRSKTLLIGRVYPQCTVGNTIFSPLLVPVITIHMRRTEHAGE